MKKNFQKNNFQNNNYSSLKKPVKNFILKGKETNLPNVWRAKAHFNTKFLKKALFNTKFKNNTKLKKNNTKLKKNNTKLKKIILS